MDILRNKTQGFTVVDNTILKDRNINLRDRGLYATLCSLPDGWQLSVRGLAAILPDGKAAIASSLNCLESNGYLTRRPKKERGRITGTEWEIIVPERKLELDLPEEGNAMLVNRTQGVTIVKNNIIRNQQLPIKDRGMLITLLGLPNGWKMSVEGLAAILPDGKYAVRKSLNTLEEQGYLLRRQLRETNGTWAGSIWEIWDEPLHKDFEKIETEDEEIIQVGVSKSRRDKKAFQKAAFCLQKKKHAEKKGFLPQKGKQPPDSPVIEILQADTPDKENSEPDDSS